MPPIADGIPSAAVTGPAGNRYSPTVPRPALNRLWLAALLPEPGHRGLVGSSVGFPAQLGGGFQRPLPEGACSPRRPLSATGLPLTRPRHRLHDYGFFSRWRGSTTTSQFITIGRLGTRVNRKRSSQDHPRNCNISGSAPGTHQFHDQQLQQAHYKTQHSPQPLDVAQLAPGQVANQGLQLL